MPRAAPVPRPVVTATRNARCQSLSAPVGTIRKTVTGRPPASNATANCTHPLAGSSASGTTGISNFTCCKLGVRRTFASPTSTAHFAGAAGGNNDPAVDSAPTADNTFGNGGNGATTRGGGSGNVEANDNPIAASSNAIARRRTFPERTTSEIASGEAYARRNEAAGNGRASRRTTRRAIATASDPIKATATNPTATLDHQKANARRTGERRRRRAV